MFSGLLSWRRCDFSLRRINFEHGLETHYVSVISEGNRQDLVCRFELEAVGEHPAFRKH